MLAPLQRENLRTGCARKGIQYKHAGIGAKSLGPNAARTLLEHVQSDGTKQSKSLWAVEAVGRATFNIGSAIASQVARRCMQRNASIDLVH